MDWFDPAGIAYAVATITLAAATVFARRREAHNPTVSASLTFTLAGVCWWSASLTVAYASTSETVAAIATLAILTGVGVMMAGFLGLGICIAWPQWVPRRGVVAALLVEPVLITLASATNPWHQTVYGGVGAAELTGSAGWTNGPVFWLHTAYRFLAIVVSISLIARAWAQSRPTFRVQRLALFFAALVPGAANAAYAAGAFGDIIDPGPLSIAAIAAIMACWIIRQDVFALSPVARALVIDQIGDAVVVISPVGRVLDLNPAAIELVRSLSPDAPTDLVGSSAHALFGQGLATADGGETEVVVELPGGRAEFQVRSSLLVDRNKRSLGTVLVARDVTEANAQSRRLAAAHAQLVRQVETIERLRADLVELASRDTLTGLHNRRHMIDSFGSMVAAAKNTGELLAVILFDVDRFKAINDSYGHLAGDTVLIAIAQQLQAHAPTGALVARWGGEEFFIALPGADAVTGLAFADDLRHRCEVDGINVAGRIVHSTLSGGVAAYPGSGTTVDELFHAADITMYEAKDAGRNLVLLHPGLTPPAGVDVEPLCG